MAGELIPHVLRPFVVAPQGIQAALLPYAPHFIGHVPLFLLNQVDDLSPHPGRCGYDVGEPGQVLDQLPGPVRGIGIPDCERRRPFGAGMLQPPEAGVQRP